MKIRPEELEKLGELLVSTYRAKELMVAKADDALIKKKIVEIIAHNFAEEEAIEEETRKMLAAHARETQVRDHAARPVGLPGFEERLGVSEKRRLVAPKPEHKPE